MLINDFYSRASCEARQDFRNAWANLTNFYSRASCEARRQRGQHERRVCDFYSRASCEARHGTLHEFLIYRRFLLTRLV